jgi:hypothetical protein
MDSRQVLRAVAVVVAVSLVAAPLTMADWGEQASFSADRIEQSEVGEGAPVVPFTDLSPSAQSAVKRAIASPDGRHTVYGKADWPERFSYGDSVSRYVVNDDGAYYRLETYASGGFPFVYWILELPFVVYGLVLGYSLSTRENALRTAGLTVPGIAFHLLGPAFDFPIGELGFLGVGLLTMFGAVLGLVWESRWHEIQTRSGRA